MVRWPLQAQCQGQDDLQCALPASCRAASGDPRWRSSMQRAPHTLQRCQTNERAPPPCLPTRPPAPAQALPPAGKCSAVLTYSRLLLGVLLPAALEAATELRLYREHQRERRLAGLPAERCSGTQARLYAVLGRLRDALHGPTAVVAVWVAMGLLFDLVLVLAQ